eukprot:2304506-Rhodomonas_salina.1
MQGTWHLKSMGLNTSTGMRAPPGRQPGSTGWTRFRSPVPVPLWGDHGRGSPVSAADALSAEVSASTPLAEVRLFKACLSRRALPLSEGAAGICQPFRGLAVLTGLASAAQESPFAQPET